MNEKSVKEQLEELEDQRLIRDRIAASTRAMSITVGTAFGGTTEISMRGDAGQSLWCLMQPVEVIELIHQLAANVGCLVSLKPRKDFASWRDWRVTDEEHERLNGWAPWVNDMAPYSQLGAKGMDPEVLKALEAGGQLIEAGGGTGGKSGTNLQGANGQPGANAFVGVNHGKENDALAIKKTVKRRTTQRSSKAT